MILKNLSACFSSQNLNFFLTQAICWIKQHSCSKQFTGIPGDTIRDDSKSIIHIHNYFSGSVWFAPSSIDFTSNLLSEKAYFQDQFGSHHPTLMLQPTYCHNHNYLQDQFGSHHPSLMGGFGHPSTQFDHQAMRLSRCQR